MKAAIPSLSKWFVELASYSSDRRTGLQQFSLMRFICRPVSVLTDAQLPSPKQPPTGNNRQIGEHQTEGQARHEAERLDPSRYDDKGQNVGDEQQQIILVGVRHDRRGLSLMGLDCNRTRERRVLEGNHSGKMCGRFKAGFEFREIKVRWQIFNDLVFTAHYNIAPTQTHPIIVERAGALEARPIRWGLVPFWAKDQAIGNKMINPRSETLAERPAPP